MRKHPPRTNRGLKKTWVLFLALIASVALSIGETWDRFHRHVRAQAPSVETVTDQRFDLGFVPRDSVLVFTARPTLLLARPALLTVKPLVEKSTGEEMPWGVAPKDVRELTVALVLSNEPKPAFMPIIILRLTSSESAQKVIAGLGPDGQPHTFGKYSYVRVGPHQCFCRIDERSILYSPNEPALKRSLAAGTAGASTTIWAGNWATQSRKDAVAVVNTALLRGLPQGMDEVAAMLSEVNRLRDRRTQAGVSELGVRLGALWQKSDYAVASVAVSDKLDLRIISQSATEDEAKDVHGALLTAISVIRLTLSRARDSVASQSSVTDPLALEHLDLLDEILEKAQIVRRENQVGAMVNVDAVTTSKIGAALAPAVSSAKAVSERSASINNLRQIGLAFHNYHDTYKTFPAAIQIGPKNIPHSWRITLLPFLDQAPLYKQYRQDEPWDSESNKKVLAEMPSVFRCPRDQRTSQDTSYFTFVGPETLFGSRKAIIAQIVDGTSNTILVVESKRQVPWTKPDEIEFDSRQAVMPLGGWYPNGFCLVMFDGRALFLPQHVDQQLLKYMIMHSDGNPVQIPDAR